MSAPQLTPQQTVIARMLRAAAGTPVAGRYLCTGAQTTWEFLKWQISHMRRAGLRIERREHSFILRETAV